MGNKITISELLYYHRTLAALLLFLTAIVFCFLHLITGIIAMIIFGRVLWVEIEDYLKMKNKRTVIIMNKNSSDGNVIKTGLVWGLLFWILIIAVMIKIFIR
jgi:hypothetical protein